MAIGNSATIRSVPLPLKQPVIQLTKWMAERNSHHGVFQRGPDGLSDRDPALGGAMRGLSVQHHPAAGALQLWGPDGAELCRVAGGKDVERALLRRLNQYDPEVTVAANYGREVWNIP